MRLLIRFKMATSAKSLFPRDVKVIRMKMKSRRDFVYNYRMQFDVSSCV